MERNFAVGIGGKIYGKENILLTVLLGAFILGLLGNLHEVCGAYRSYVTSDRSKPLKRFIQTLSYVGRITAYASSGWFWVS